MIKKGKQKHEIKQEGEKQMKNKQRTKSIMEEYGRPGVFPEVGGWKVGY